MASVLPLVPILLPLVLALPTKPLGAQARQQSLLVETRSGLGPGPWSLESLGLGRGGLPERSRWHKEPRRLSKDEIRTRGGARLHFGGDRLLVRMPGGAWIGMDWRGAFVGEQGAVTLPAHQGVQLRLDDGSEIRLMPGDMRYGPRELVLVDGDRRYLLRRRKHLLRGSGKASATQGLCYYLAGKGDWLLSITGFGTFLWVEPVAVHGRAFEPRLLILGDRLVHGARRILDTSPRRSVQFPLARKQAQAIHGFLARSFPAEEVDVKQQRLPWGSELVFGLGESRLRIGRFGPARNQCLQLALHLQAGAGATLEYQSLNKGTQVQRVLAKRFQTRSRYQGRPVPLFAKPTEDWVWNGSLASKTQRRRVLAKLAPWIDGKGREVPVEASGSRGDDPRR